MLRKFGYSLVVIGALMFGVGVVNTVLVGSAMAEEKKCDKCGHLPSQKEADCKCECHHQNTKQESMFHIVALEG